MGTERPDGWFEWSEEMTAEVLYGALVAVLAIAGLVLVVAVAAKIEERPDRAAHA